MPPPPAHPATGLRRGFSPQRRDHDGDERPPPPTATATATTTRRAVATATVATPGRGTGTGTPARTPAGTPRRSTTTPSPPPPPHSSALAGVHNTVSAASRLVAHLVVSRAPTPALDAAALLRDVAQDAARVYLAPLALAGYALAPRLLQPSLRALARRLPRFLLAPVAGDAPWCPPPAAADAAAANARPLGETGVTVYIVETGGSDIDLLPVRAHRLLQSAALIVADHDVPQAVLDAAAPAETPRCRRTAAAAEDGALPLREIAATPVSASGAAPRRDHVVHLVGGGTDALPFGAGGRAALADAAAYRAAGQRPVLLPGVNRLDAAVAGAFLGASADEVLVVTAASGRAFPPYDARRTLVVPVADAVALTRVVQRLVRDGGYAVDVACAGVWRGSCRGDQSVVTGCLATIAARVRQQSQAHAVERPGGLAVTAPWLLILGPELFRLRGTAA
ncbi:hypothetical protein CXG81DRAFT_26123 [Caulochytrium protostelioides]|uniref:Tetrapyrrole methylase domain-containing protein n=1 Tax=Caulochytrium protostelioides TaxID=1555241 RepID=A0A4P9X7J6_9FUNG|nr:hypothetical protein CXG81DRAFT_26123 [Caulochytrium protostelioides]|eukprot:RKP01205.1 hypothetical protein CXG81DRAFT_26123 [Caulochytrium protostelioides]